jgi:hypothetical protein
MLNESLDMGCGGGMLPIRDGPQWTPIGKVVVTALILLVVIAVFTLAVLLDRDALKWVDQDKGIGRYRGKLYQMTPVEKVVKTEYVPVKDRD